jgi:CrcB protein
VTFLAVALGGAFGAVLRWALGEAVPDGAGFPWTTFLVNLSGSAVLAGLPALAAVRRRPRLAAGLGPGVLGGFTTLSAYAEETRALLAHGQTLTALAYLLGTLAACVAAVSLVGRLSPPAAAAVFAAEGGEE